MVVVTIQDSHVILFVKVIWHEGASFNMVLVECGDQL